MARIREFSHWNSVTSFPFVLLPVVSRTPRSGSLKSGTARETRGGFGLLEVPAAPGGRSEEPEIVGRRLSGGSPLEAGLRAAVRGLCPRRAAPPFPPGRRRPGKVLLTWAWPLLARGPGGVAPLEPGPRPSRGRRGPEGFRQTKNSAGNQIRKLELEDFRIRAEVGGRGGDGGEAGEAVCLQEAAFRCEKRSGKYRASRLTNLSSSFCNLLPAKLKNASCVCHIFSCF